MKNLSLKKFAPHLIALLLFFIVPVIYFSPVLENKQLNQHDSMTYIGMSKEVVDYNKQHDDLALWTNSMFGGMPSYLVAMPTNTPITILYTVTNLFNFRPVNFVFLYLLGFFIALLLFGINPWLAIIGAFAFGFGSYNFIIIAAGHASKAIAIGYMAPIIAAVYYTLRKNIWLGGAIFGLFLALEIYAGHPQITYYTFLIILIMGIFESVAFFKNKQLADFTKRIAVLALFAILAVGANTARLWTTMEYGNYSLRGKSDLTTDQANKTTGLDRDYATHWSYGIGETLTLLIPNFNGGSSAVGFDQDSETGVALRNNNVPNANQIVKQLPGYWGEQPGTSGPVYFGATLCFLFILSLFLLDKTTRGWILVATILSIMLAWGKNFMPLTDLFLDYFPGYNKFRTVTMILVIAGFTFPLASLLALQKIIFGDLDLKKIQKPILISAAIAGGLSLIFALIPSLAGSFISSADGQFPEWLQKTIASDRSAMLRSDALRSTLFVAVTALLLLAFAMKKLKLSNTLIALGVLVIIDLWGVDKRYLNNDLFVEAQEAKNPFKASVADQQILQDKSDYRVLNLTTSPFADVSTSYFHKSIGGYHGAKIRRYQELADRYTNNEMMTIGERLQKVKSQAGVDSVFLGLNVLNMLNTKYIIYNPQTAPLLNKSALGNAWFVAKCKKVENADQEIAQLKQINPAKEVVVDRKFGSLIPDGLVADSTAKIMLNSYSPNKLIYTSESKTQQIAVFSEIYYPKGWNSFIDGKPADHFQANFVLRSMVIPQGKHTIEFRFEPRSALLGMSISFWVSLILLLLVLAAMYKSYKECEQEEKI